MIREKLFEGSVALVIMIIMSVSGFYFNTQINSLKDILTVTQGMQIELARRGEWMEWVSKEIVDLNTKSIDRYTKTEADKDLGYLERRIQGIESDVKKLEQKEDR